MPKHQPIATLAGR